MTPAVFVAKLTYARKRASLVVVVNCIGILITHRLQRSGVHQTVIKRLQYKTNAGKHSDVWIDAIKREEGHVEPLPNKNEELDFAITIFFDSAQSKGQNAEWFKCLRYG